METWTIYKKNWLRDIEYQGETHPVYGFEPYLKCPTEQSAKNHIKFFYSERWNHKEGESYSINRHSWDPETQRAYDRGEYQFGSFNGRNNIRP